MKAENSKTALIVFAREPEDGLVKTRLLKDLPVPVVSSLYKAFLKDILLISRKVQCSHKFIYYTGSPRKVLFLNQFRHFFTLKKQHGRDLGARMFSAFSEVFRGGFQRVVIIGVDCISLSANDISVSFKCLDRNDCVLGPSQDGGYYLIGLKSPEKAIFADMPWGEGSVLRETVKRLKRHSRKISLLRVQRDIDTYEDIKKEVRKILYKKKSSNTKLIFRKTFT